MDEELAVVWHGALDVGQGRGCGLSSFAGPSTLAYAIAVQGAVRGDPVHRDERAAARNRRLVVRRKKAPEKYGATRRAQIRALYQQPSVTLAIIARRYHMSISTVHNIVQKTA